MVRGEEEEKQERVRGKPIDKVLTRMDLRSCAEDLFLVLVGQDGAFDFSGDRQIANIFSWHHAVL